MNVEFRRSFVKDLKDLEKVGDKRLRQRVRDIITAVEAAETLDGVSNVRKLRDADAYYRIRVGDYRIGITWDGETVVFVRFLHRKDLYRYFP